MRAFYLAFIFLSLFSCKSKKVAIDSENSQEVWIIADRRQDCTGVGPMSCLVYKVEGSDEWHFLYDGIRNFDPKEGIHYRIRVDKKELSNPPADASSIVYSLVEVLEEREARPIEGVINDSWGVVELDGMNILPKEQQITLEMNTRTARFMGHSGCNSYGGQLLVIDGDSRSIQLSGMFSTEMYCDGKMDLENKYHQALRKVDRLEFKSAEVHLFEGEILRIRAKRID